MQFDNENVPMTTPLSPVGQDGMGKSSSEGPHVRSHGLKDSGVGSQSNAQQPSGMSELQSRGALCRGGNTLQTCLYTSPDRTPGLHVANMFERFRDTKVALVKASAQGELC